MRRGGLLLGLRELTLVPVIVLVIVIGAFASDAFLTTDNFLNILQQSSELSVVVIAETLILLAGKFDLSLESVVGLAPMLGAWLIIKNVEIGGSGVGLAWWLAIPVVLLTGAVVGAINGFLIVQLRLNAFIVTLAMLILLRGVQLGTTSGKTLFDLPDGYLYLGSGKWMGIPVSIWIAAHPLPRVRPVPALPPARPRAVRDRRQRRGRARRRHPRRPRAVGHVHRRRHARRPRRADADRAHRLGRAESRPEHDLLRVRGGGDRRHQPKRRQGPSARRADRRAAAGILQNVLTLAEIPAFWIDAVYGAIILIALVVSWATGGTAEET